MLGVITPCTSLAFIPKAYRFINFGRSSDLLRCSLPSHSMIMNSDFFTNNFWSLQLREQFRNFTEFPFNLIQGREPKDMQDYKIFRLAFKEFDCALIILCREERMLKPPEILHQCWSFDSLR